MRLPGAGGGIPAVSTGNAAAAGRRSRDVRRASGLVYALAEEGGAETDVDGLDGASTVNDLGLQIPVRARRR